MRRTRSQHILNQMARTRAWLYSYRKLTWSYRPGIIWDFHFAERGRPIPNDEDRRKYIAYSIIEDLQDVPAEQFRHLAPPDTSYCVCGDPFCAP